MSRDTVEKHLADSVTHFSRKLVLPFSFFGSLLASGEHER